MDEANPNRPILTLVKTVDIPHVFADQPLHVALERMSSFHLDCLPVVHRADAHRLEGMVTLKDVLDAYGVGETE